MTEAECLNVVNTQITSWRSEGYNYAANLLEYFINRNRGENDYTPTAADINEVRVYGKPKIGTVIDAYVNETESAGSVLAGIHAVYKYGPGNVNVRISHPGRGSTAPSNIRWWYIGSNENMLYAFGGADLNVTGVATVRVAPPNRTWSGIFRVTVGDLYTFDSQNGLKTWLSSVWSDSYDAALILEREHRYRPFYHTAAVHLSFTGMTTRIAGYL